MQMYTQHARGHVAIPTGSGSSIQMSSGRDSPSSIRPWSRAPPRGSTRPAAATAESREARGARLMCTPMGRWRRQTAS
eukprot:scaffold38653_cov63-Phaeocystis_antarctica.AAC.1